MRRPHPWPGRARTTARPGTGALGGGVAVAVLVAAVALAGSAPPASAAEFRTGTDPQVAAGTTVDDDLYLSGNRARIAGDVTGDVVAAARDLTVNGEIGGSLDAAVATADLRGPIGRSLRLAAGEITLTSTVGGDLIVLGGTVTVAREAVIAGDAIVAGGTLIVNGEVEGDVRAAAGEVTIAGPVGGDVRAEVGRLTLADSARIAGDLRYRVAADRVDIAPGAAIDGATVADPPRADDVAGVDLPGNLGWALARLLAALIAGLVIVLLLPRAAARTADGVRREPLAALLIGLLLAVLIPLGIVVLLITLVGIPIALIVAAVYAAALYLSQVVVGLAVGRTLLPKRWDTAGRGYNLLAMTIGVILLAALRLIPLPFVGGIVSALTALLGLGALRVGLRHRPTTAPALGGRPEPGTSYVR